MSETISYTAGREPHDEDEDAAMLRRIGFTTAMTFCQSGSWADVVLAVATIVLADPDAWARVLGLPPPHANRGEPIAGLG